MGSVIAAFVAIGVPTIITLAVALCALPFRATASILQGIGALKSSSFGDWLVYGLALAGAIVVIHVVVRLGRRATADATGSRWHLPWAGLAFVAVLLASGLFSFIEWGGHPLLPDVLSSVPTIAISTLVMFTLTAVAAVSVYRLTRWMYRTALPRPFAAGLLAMGLFILSGGTGATLPLKAAAQNLNLAKAVNTPAQRRLVERLRGDPSIDDSGCPGDEDELIEFVPTAHEGRTTGEKRLDSCMLELGPAPPPGSSEWRKTMSYLTNGFRLTKDEAYDIGMTALINVCTTHSVKVYDRVAAVFTTAVRNKALNEIEKRARRDQRIVIDPVDGELLQTICPFAPTDEIRLATEMHIVRQTLKGLSDQTRRALHMKFSGTKVPEIARTLGLPYAKVRSTIDNAIKKLRRTVTTGCYPEKLAP